MKRTYSAAEDRMLAVLKSDGMIAFNKVKSVVELNALRDLTKRGLARFARFSKVNSGYILVGHSLLDEVA